MSGERRRSVRKRGGSWSSSSSLVQSSYRLKRGVGIRGGGGSSTPVVPIWKLNDTTTDLSVSARKLGATLWEEEEDMLLNSSKFNSDPLSERIDRSKVGRSSQKRQFSLQTEQQVQHRLKDVRCGLSATKELLKVLNRVWSLDEHHHQSTCLSLFSAIKSELDQACIQVTKLIHEHNVLFEKEKMKEHTAIAQELKIEKKLRKQTERLNKKLGKELGDTKTCLSKALKEVEGEKRAREIVEQVCDELARGIGEDRAEVLELKKQTAKVREEVDKEREMLQLADVLREERVQMKLSEARYEFEGKNEVVDKLRNELEAYLRSKKQDSPNYEKIKQLERHLRDTLPSTCYYQVVNDDDDDDDDSADSDLHSIELKMDDDKSKGRRRFIPERQTSDGIEWEFAVSGKDKVDTCESNLLENGVILYLSCRQVWKKDCEDEIERYEMIKNLRDHIISASTISSP